MKNTRHLIISVAITIFILSLGTWGYMSIEGWNFMDALYMTVITISTVGFREVHRISNAGRFFTMALVFFGIMFTLYIAGAIVQFMIEGRIRSILGRRRLDRKIKHMKNHYIVCGYGRIGRVLCRSLSDNGLDVVAVEKNEARIPVMEEDRVVYVAADAVDEAALQLAGIERSRGLIAVLGSDIDNVFLVLTARQLQAELFITARAGSKDVGAKLKAAGANVVESPYEMGAVSMARKIMRPAVTNFLELAFANTRKDIQMEEISVGDTSPLVGVTLKDSGIRQKFNLIIIAIRKADGDMIFNPSFETRLAAGNMLIAVGETENLARFARYLNP